MCIRSTKGYSTTGMVVVSVGVLFLIDLLSVWMRLFYLWRMKNCHFKNYVMRGFVIRCYFTELLCIQMT
jgi:hypothetical protein